MTFFLYLSLWLSLVVVVQLGEKIFEALLFLLELFATLLIAHEELLGCGLKQEKIYEIFFFIFKRTIYI